jgi:transposase
MAMVTPYLVELTDADRRMLTRRAPSERVAHREVRRAQIILAAADGASNAEIARRVGVCDDTVRKWRARFCQQGLADRPRPDRQRTFPKTAEAEVQALACQLPAESDVPLTR